MTIAHDAASQPTAGTGELSWTHTPVGIPRAVVVAVIQNDPFSGATDQVTGVTYGGVAMTEVAASPLVRAISEGGVVYVYFLGASVPTGAQTVVVSVSGASVKQAAAMTMTAAGDCSVHDTSVLDTSAGAPVVTVNITAESHIYGFLQSSANAATWITELTGQTRLFVHDYGTQTAYWSRWDTLESADQEIGWTDTVQGAGAPQGVFGIAITEAGAPPRRVDRTTSAIRQASHRASLH